MRSRLLWVLVGVGVAGASGAVAAEARPNVLLIVSDDLNVRLGCYGAAEAKMPTPPEPAGHEKDIPEIAWAPRSERNLTVAQRRESVVQSGVVAGPRRP